MSTSSMPSGGDTLPPYARDTAPVHGVLAEYDAPGPLMAACEKVRDAGYTCWDAHTPFPVHGLDDAMGMRPTRLPWAVLLSGITGLCAALLMQWWMNTIDYAFIISGKPLFSLPAFVPVCFELTVLFSAFMCFFGTLGRNGLPELFHPLALQERFRRATNDRFFIYIEARDPQFDRAKVEKLLGSTSHFTTHVVHYEPFGTHTHLPAGTTGIAAILAVLSLLPLALFARARESTSEKPRIHANPPAPVKDDMDIQYKFKPQTTNWFFADNRAMRPFPQGAVADEDPVVLTALHTGKMDVVAQLPGTTEPGVKKASGAKKDPRAGRPAQPATPAAAGSGYVTALPPEIVPSTTLMARGAELFENTCAVCHGQAGHGDGLVAQHAEALQEGTWVAPTNLHDERVRKLPLGDLYNTVTHGVRNMPGYGHLIVHPEDRWGVVMYVKALQLSQHAPASAVPADVLSTLK